MNLLLLTAGDFVAPDRVTISGRRHQHLLDILKAEPGQPLRAGLLDGPCGTASIVCRDAERTTLDVRLDQPPRPPVPLTVLLALPRPKVLRRLLPALAAFGGKRIVLLNTARVDKSYWQSPFLEPETLHEQLLLGLEQAGDTLLPEVLLRRRFRPFVEDELPALTAGHRCFVGHPYDAAPCPAAVAGPLAVAIGPEGGFVPFEIELLGRCGFQAVHLGNRPLRVETAAAALLGRLLPFTC